MQIVVKANPIQKAVLETLNWSQNHQLYWVTGLEYPSNADLYFDLCYEEEGWGFATIQSTLVFVNAVIDCSSVLPANAIRINAWNSFLERPVWEIASSNKSNTEKAKSLLEKLSIQSVVVTDEPGLVAVRVIAMIINEAYFALEEQLSSKTEIDIAMKLGTNYPYGPFEWANMIGLHKIANLLTRLNSKDKRYTPAPALLQELA